MTSNRQRRAEPYRVGDRVIITERYRGAVGPAVHNRAGEVHKVIYPPKKGGKIIWVHLDKEHQLPAPGNLQRGPVTSVVLCFADELDREKTQEQRVEEWAEDTEGKQLVRNILDRKAAEVPGPLYFPRPGRTYLPREEGVGE